MINKLCLIAIGCTLILFSSCFVSKKNTNVKNELIGTNWQLMSVQSTEGGNPILLPSETKPTLNFDSKENRVSGSTGCNRFMGGYTVNGTSLTFEKLATTMMMCIDDMNIEAAVLNAFQAINSYKIQGEELLLMDDNVVLLTYSKLSN